MSKYKYVEQCHLCHEVRHYLDCPECDGTGHIGIHRCNWCEGYGWFRECVNPRCLAFSKSAAEDLKQKESRANKRLQATEEHRA